MRLTKEKLELRRRLLPFLGMFTCDTGGVLNRVVHLYHYNDFDHRDKVRSLVHWRPAAGPFWACAFCHGGASPRWCTCITLMSLTIGIR